MAISKSESRAGTPISLVIIHTNEGDHKPDLPDDHTAEDLAAYLDRANAAGDWKSYHKICDDDSTVTYVSDDQASWAALAANLRSLNLCFTGWAHWSTQDWLAHDRMLRRGAAEVAKWCSRYSIPTSKLTPPQVGANQRGCCGHVDWTIGKSNGNHTDPGSSFPWELFLGYVRGGATTLEETMIIPGIDISGVGRKIIEAPVGSADGYSGRRITVSVSALDLKGAGKVKIYCQSDTAGIEDWTWTEKDLAPSKDNVYPRKYRELKDGTTKIIIDWDLQNAVDGTLTLEIKPTK